MDSIIGSGKQQGICAPIPILGVGKASGLVPTSAVVVEEDLQAPFPLTTIAIGEDLQAIDGIDPDDIRFDGEEEDVDDEDVL